MANPLDDNITYISLQNLKVSLTDMLITNSNDGAQTQLRIKEAELLKYLCQRYPNVALRTDIAENVWANTYASEFTINQTVNSLRSKLFNQGKALIITVPKRGYKLGVQPEFHTSIPPLPETNDAGPEITTTAKPETAVPAPSPKKKKKPEIRLSKPMFGLITILASLLIVFGVSFTQQEDIEAVRINNTFILFTPNENELKLINETLQSTHYDYIDKVSATIYGCGEDKQCINITP
ncbi:winged helix-turn-helix domain-containing protein [Photobacterium sp. OFAV2-7]|uniref:winged helix-turn-helix domain-containing protein n=1 Tax=Photobacterium sp. OFAV2-7 TaxID=2917748 RepID=UPI001EF70D1C|nr:winged helix-turn-helix domain-containing protein [Photobacterium sp. OFAV2-7]MCG7586038.1 winged helix-turn-helix domain-containing protein [Photobacterium sp. OFAV2-7]